MPIALLALAIAAFGIGTTEFVIMGLLPQVAADFGVSIPAAGHLITGYALGVVIGAPLLTAVAVRLRRKTMLLGMMGLFTVGNVATALAPTYDLMMASRVLAGLPHGAFFGVGSVVAASMVAENKRARAVSLMFLGLTLANVLGVPLSTIIGSHMSWRTSFWGVSVIGVLSMIGISLLVPRQPRATGASLGKELAAFRKGQVWLSLGVVTLGFGGVFATYTYITPMMTEVAGFGVGGVTLLLVLFGLGTTTGNLVGGRLADRALMPTLYGAMIALGAMLALFVVTAHNQVLAAITVFLIGACSMAASPAVQTRLMDKAAEAPTLAAAANQSASNIANAAGAYLGGLVIQAGYGYTAPNAVGAVLAVVGVSLALLSGLLDRRERRAAVPNAAGSAAGVAVAAVLPATGQHGQLASDQHGQPVAEPAVVFAEAGAPVEAGQPLGDEREPALAVAPA
ncbi:MFS transporter [Goodfellowiella coeruleoviolacea]|uniref:MFS transporter, DHA1 family, arabinose polymer transporter n=1 Tax=Goodfellowiella coeruleoviolacea TaxID=334858 RepID=A0AAE3GCQ8_9PSEU|nr:MFS transporter [Goodfellowiella coeruleoviolacea]MCP2165000.1 MFS transporter, DHA1 family, arabinose polymer transporter [Goodfellowiella coeruleoviolacea]